MRSLLFALAAFIAVPCVAQDRIFRASSIDIEQNERLDHLGIEIKQLAESVEAKAAGVEWLESRVTALEQKQPPTASPSTILPGAPKPVQKVAQSPTPQPPATNTAQRYTTDQLRYKIQQLRPGGWQGAVYATMAPGSDVKQHLISSEHGFSWNQVAGLTHSEAMILHDLAPRHGNKIFPSYIIAQQRSAQPAPQPVQNAPQQPFTNFGIQQKNAVYDPNCPNGNCDRSQYQQAQSQPRVLFPNLGRRFR